MFLLLRNSEQPTPSLVPFVPSGSFVGYGIESGYNELAPPTVYIPASSMQFEDIIDYRFVENLRRNLSRDKRTKSSQSYTGSIDVNLSSSGIGGVLCSLLGCDAPIGSPMGSGFFSYTFMPQYTNGPSLSLVVNTETSHDTGVVIRRSGALVTTYTVSASFGDLVTARTDLTGPTSILGEILDFSPYYQEVEGFGFSDVSVLINDVIAPDIKSFELSVANGIEPLTVVRSSVVPSIQTRRSFEVNLSMDVGLEDSEYWEYLNESDEVKVRLDIGNGQESFIVDMSRMLIASSSLPVQASSRDNTQTIQMTSLGGTAVPVMLTLEAKYF